MEQIPAPQPQDFADVINASPDGWTTTTGLHFLRACRDEVSAELTIGPQHLQAYGIVHGGIHAGIIEALASVGAALDVMPRGHSAVGLENHTSFLHAVRAGKLRAHRQAPDARAPLAGLGGHPSWTSRAARSRPGACGCSSSIPARSSRESVSRSSSASA